MNIIGIDPGIQTGIACFEDGEILYLATLSPMECIDGIQTIQPDMICFEDSRLQSVVFKRGVNSHALLKIARDVGSIDAQCRLLVELCGQLGIAYHGVSPKAKGSKLDAKQFEAKTGWTGRSNQHERDAAMVAWPYRNMRVNT